MRKLLSLLLCITVLFSSFGITANAAYTAETGENYISFDYNTVGAGNVNNIPNTIVEKDAVKDGVAAMKFTPDPANPEARGIFTADCFGLGSYGAKITVPEYKYVGVTYYYETQEQFYKDSLSFSILPGTSMATKKLTKFSDEPMVANKWTEALFNFSDVMELSDEAKNPWIVQCHFSPFGETPASQLKASESFYIEKYTFYTKHPNPNFKPTIRFEKGTPDAKGDSVVISPSKGETYTLPENPFTYENADFLGWRYGNETFPSGTQVVATDANRIYTAAWNVRKIYPEYKSFDYHLYSTGMADGSEAATLEKTESDGTQAILVTHDPTYSGTGKLTLDANSFQNADISLDHYKYVAVEYRYDSKTPLSDLTMECTLMRDGGALTGNVKRVSASPLICGTRAVAVFDFSDIANSFDTSKTEHLLQRMQISPYGSTPLSSIPKDDRMYISRVMFFCEKPDFETHTAYMNGYEDGSFRPSGTMTRAEACTVVARLLETEENISGTSSFSDVTPDKWYAKYIGFCEGRGLLGAYSGDFTPDIPITRAEFAELVYLTGLASDKGAAVSFADVSESHPKYTSIKAASSAGLINGYLESDNTYTFRPDNTITRAEVVTVINRARARSTKTEELPSGMILVASDVNATHWAFADIAEATVPHVEWNNEWLYSLADPIKALGEKIDTASIFRTEEGKAKIAELDTIEAERIAEIRATPSMELADITGKKIYVSSTEGDDNNDGLTESAPVKTLSAANSKASSGDAVLLKRGDLWRESLAAKQGVTYTAYGTGEKPKLYGSPENGADPEKWALIHKDETTGALIWQYKNQTMTDIGTLILGSDGYALKEIPSCREARFVMRGNPGKSYNFVQQMNRNYEFFHAANSAISNDVIDVNRSVGTLYFRCDDGNPGKVFDSIEFNTRGNIITVGGTDVTIDNICIMYGGSHGIASGTTKNLTVTNCEIGFIGGSIQSYDKNGNAIRYGNGVEIFGGCDGYTVDNCYIYQCYDAGVTHQYSAAANSDCIMDNITYSDNVITDCVYSIEYFLGNAANSGSYTRKGKNHLFEGNLLRRAGYGFGSTRPDGSVQRHIRSGSGTRNEFENYVIRNNIFDRSVYELIEVYSDFDSTAPKMEGNTYIQGIDGKLFRYGKGKTGSTDISADSAIRTVIGDTNGKMYFVDSIPYYTYTFKAPMTALVSDDDFKEWAPFGEAGSSGVSADMGESTEVYEPLVIRTRKNHEAEKMYQSINRMTAEKMTDPETGTIFDRMTIANEQKTVNMDCFGLPPFDVSSGVVYFKILARTNHSAIPTIRIYQLKDENGASVSGGGKAEPAEPWNTNGEWQEIILKSTDIPQGAMVARQIHIFPFGQNLWGANLYNEDGTPKTKGLYFDIAAWAAFPNLASAEAFDLKAAAKK